MKPLPLFLFSMLIGLVVLSVVSEDRSFDSESLRLDETKTDVLSDPIEWVEATLEVEGKAYLVSLPQGSSAHDLMVKVQETSDFQFGGKEFPGLGFFIQEINGLEQSPRLGKYWIYYINGKKAEVGISAYTVNTHDIISWKYEDEE